MGLFRAPAWMIKGGAGGGGGARRAWQAAGGDVPGEDMPYAHITGYGTGNTIQLPHISYNGYHTVINDDNGYYYTYERSIHGPIHIWRKGTKVQ